MSSAIFSPISTKKSKEGYSEKNANLSLVDLFEQQVELHPNKSAVSKDLFTCTYFELDQKSNQLAYKLTEMGVKTGTVVGLLVESTIEMVVAMLGILKAGAVYLPINIDYPRERIDFMLKDANAEILLVQGKLQENIKNYQGMILDLNAQDTYSTKNDIMINQLKPENLACLFYTSGTTGNPKGVMVEHSHITQLVNPMNFITFSQDDVIAQVSNLAFDGATFEIWGGLLNGLELVLIDKNTLLSPKKLLHKIIDNKITIMFFTPALFNILVDECIEIFSLLKTVVLGGDIVNKNKALKVLRMNKTIQLVNGYGPTETITFSTTCTLSIELIEKWNCVPIGKSLPHNQIYILDEKLQPVKEDEKGEIYIGGTKVSKGYLNNKKLTNLKFIPNVFEEKPSKLYRTGDMAKWLPDGNIEFLGRIDNQVKVRGYRIELEEIRKVIMNWNNVKECVVIIKKDENESNHIIAYLSVHIDAPNTIPELRSFLSSFLPDYMIPSSFYIANNIPLNFNDKIDTERLVNDSAHIKSLEYKQPKTEIEKKLCGIWKELLGKDQVGVDDDFFYLGGDSLMIMQMISKAAAQSIELDLETAMEKRTIRAISEYIQGNNISNSKLEKLDIDNDINTSLLSPIESWFFSQSFAQVNLFNQSVHLIPKITLKKEMVNRTILNLIKRHEALSFCYQIDSLNIPYKRTSSKHAEDQDFCYFVQVDPIHREKIQNEFYEKINNEIHIEKGILIRAVIFEDTNNNSQVLVIVIHHLACDGMSWRILLEEFETIYNQVLQESHGKELNLPAKTTSYLEWVNYLNKLSDHQTIGDLEYWRSQLPEKQELLKTDFDFGPNLEESSDVIKIDIDSKNIKQLLTETIRFYDVNITEILIMVLYEAFYSTFGLKTFSLDIELHGRRGYPSFINLSRTVGWFTTIFPFKINLESISSFSQKLDFLKESLKTRTPIDYGLLKYMPNKDIKNISKDFFRISPEISFNYMGVLKEVFNDSLFSITPPGISLFSGVENVRSHLIDITMQIINDHGTVYFTYSKNHYKEKTMIDLAKAFKNVLLTVINQSRTISLSEAKDNSLL